MANKHIKKLWKEISSEYSNISFDEFNEVITSVYRHGGKSINKGYEFRVKYLCSFKFNHTSINNKLNYIESKEIKKEYDTDNIELLYNLIEKKDDNSEC